MDQAPTEPASCQEDTATNHCPPTLPVKKKRGRPRIHPVPDPNAPKRPRGRPRIHPITEEIEGLPPFHHLSAKDFQETRKRPLPEWEHTENDGETSPEIPPHAIEPWPQFEEEVLENGELQEAQEATWFWIEESYQEEIFSQEEDIRSIVSRHRVLHLPPQEGIPANEPVDEDPVDEEALPVEVPPEDEEDIRPKKGKNALGSTYTPSSQPDLLDIYYRQIRDNPPLTLQEEQELSRKYLHEGCLKSREKMIHANLKLVVHLAKRYREMLRVFSCGMSFADLISEGNIGLMKAIDKYDPERGNKISTYASWWIGQQIQAALHRKGKLIRVPSHLLNKMRKVQRIVDEYQTTHGKLDPKQAIPQGLVDQLHTSGFKANDLHSMKEILNISSPNLSLDATAQGGSSESGGEGPALHESIEDESAQNPFLQSAASADSHMINEILQTLRKKEREIICARFGLNGQEPKTLEEVGNIMNVTRERIRQIQEQALEIIKKKILKRKKQAGEAKTEALP
jgi:RNA polymerase primary sigma factor